MKIFVAGGTGAVGKRLAALLVSRGHRVFATTRRPEKAAGLRAAGAEPIVVDGLETRLTAIQAWPRTRPSAEAMDGGARID